MTTLPRGTASTHATDAFDFIYGRFEISGGWTIPYLSTIMTFRQAKESLNLVTEFPGWESLQWKIEELYQRDIDWPRIEQKILPYLDNSSQPRFFNSLTVALIPVDGTAFIPEDQLTVRNWTPPIIPDEEAPGREVRFGPVTLRYYHDFDLAAISGPDAKLGKIRWNKDETFCVAIDGQHRLASIKELAGDSGDGVSRADISVLLLLFSSELGFECPAGTKQVDILRRLFIDLNKYARPVSRTRLILLDDRDPTSLCTRATIGTSLIDGFNELTTEPAVLPLTLVDWHTDGAKVDTGPYLVSVLTLDWAVHRILGTGPIADPMRHASIKNQVSRFRSKLVGLDLESALERLTECEVQSRPFSYSDNSPDELGEIVDAFRVIWSPSIACLFSAPAPYRNLVDTRATSGSDIADFSNWYQLYFRKMKDTYGGHAERDYRDLIRRWTDSRKHYLPELKKWLTQAESQKELVSSSSTSLAFTVVFQKALLYAWIDFFKLGDDIIDGIVEKRGIEIDWIPVDGQTAAGVSHLRYTRAFVSLLDEVIDQLPDFMYLQSEPDKVPLWLGTLLSVDTSTIDFNEAAAIRGQDIILMALYLQLTTEEKFHGFVDIDESMSTRNLNHTHPVHRLHRACKSFAYGSRTNAGNSAAGRILQAQQKDPDRKAFRNNLVDERLAVLRNALI